MRSLDRNRVFDTKELEQLREDTYTVFEQAIAVSEQYNQDRDEVMDLFDRVPAEAKSSGFPLWLPTDFVYPQYADQQKKCNDIFESILCHIPKFDKEAADANEELIRELKETTRTVEELRELLKTGDVRLSVSAFEAKLKHICGPDFSEEEQAKMEWRLQTLGLFNNTVLTADPVNVVNGDFVLQESDLSIRGVPFLHFVRVYNSLNQESGIFGKGWSSSYEYRLKERGDDTVTVLLPDGNRSRFEKREEQYVYATGIRGQLIKNQLEWIYQREETTVTFGEEGRPRRIRNSYGKGILLFYSKEGALLQVMGEKNYSFTFHYEQDKLVSIKDDSGRTVTYGYEGDSLSSVTDPMGGCECYSYNESDLLIKKQDRNGNQTVTNGYDEKGRVIRQQMWDGKEISYQYNEKKGYSEITYPDGHKTRYRYVPQSDTIEVTDDKNEPKWEPLCGTLLGLQPFEDMNLAIKQDREGKIIGLGKGKNQLTLTYEDQNGPSEIRTAQGMSLRFAYDTHNRIIKRTDGRGYSTCYTYDECDRMTGITYPDGNKKEYQYDFEDHLIYLKKESGEEYRLSYDAGGHLTSITDKQGRSSSLLYDDCGKLNKIQTAEGSVYAYEWNEQADRETESLSTSVPVFQGTECYDAAGNISKRIFKDGREEAYGYDCRNRLNYLQTADGGTYNFSYDQKGRCIQKTDPYGGETLFSYDEEGRVNGVTDPLGTFHAIRTQKFQVTEGEESKEAVPIEPNKESITNNSDNEPLPKNPNKEPVPDYREEQISDFPPLTMTEERDASKRLCRRTYPGGVESIYEYGKNGRIKSILHTDREGILEKREYTYDVMGNCTAIWKQSRNQTEETVCYRYDKLGRLIQVTQNQSLIREYQYDAWGNRTKKWEKGQEICYHKRKKEFPDPVTLVCKKGTDEELLYEVTTKELHFTYRVSTLPVTLEIEGETKYLLTDHLGSILRILDKEGKTEKVYEYDEYGNALLEEPQYVGYAGYPATGNGTYVTGRRFYDPTQGRFLSRDLWFGNLGDPQTYNRYLYAVDNPIRYRDASGMSPTESALLVNPFKEETKEYSFPLSLDQAVAETTSGIYKGRITEPLYQETGLDWLEKSVDWLMDTPYGDALAINGACIFFLQNPSYLISNGIKGMLIDGKSGEDVLREFIEHSRGFHGSLIKAIPKQLYHIVTFPDTVKAELKEISDISHCTNQNGFSRIFYTGNEYLNRKLDYIENGIKGTINAYLNGDARTKGEIEGKLLFSIAEIAAIQPMVNKAIKPDGVDDKQIKQTIEEQKQADIKQLCILLSYEKDLTGSEKIHRDTIINQIFEEGDIPKMRAATEELSRKRICQWTQSERSFIEQVLRYAVEKDKTVYQETNELVNKLSMDEYWLREDGYFTGQWYASEEKMNEAAEMLAREIKITGGYDLLHAGKQEEKEKRMHAEKMQLIQVLANVVRTGTFDEKTLNEMEIVYTKAGKDFSMENMTLTSEGIKLLVENEKHILLQKSGFKLELGWGEVIDGLLLLGTVAAISGYTRGVRSNAEKVTEEPPKVNREVKTEYTEVGSYSDFADGMSASDRVKYSRWTNLREAGLDQQKVNDIILTNKPYRSDPSTYLNKEYIDTHLIQFDNGASIIMTKEQYIQYVKESDFIGIPDDGTQFVMPIDYCDEVAKIANGNINVYETKLGFNKGHFEEGGGLVRIDIDNIDGLGLRMPSGNEHGANEHWIPGGITDGNVPEAVTDLIPNNANNVKVTEIK